MLIPLGPAAASLTNFAGYVAWCVWLLAMSAAVWRGVPSAAKAGVEVA
ncbi:hypothetical protein [Dactylosporangium darangshiense]